MKRRMRFAAFVVALMAVGWLLVGTQPSSTALAGDPLSDAKAKQQQLQNSNQIVLELRDDGTYAINNQVIPKDGLDAKLHEIYDNRPAKLMFVKVGDTRRHQDLIEAMDVARGAGVQVIGLTPPAEQQGQQSQ